MERARRLARVRASLEEGVRVQQALVETSAESIVRGGEILADAFREGGRALLFGNGGSASDAQHIAAEWVGRYVRERPALPAIALTANTSELSAVGNDYGYDQVFVRGVEAHGRPGDVAIAISTSGNSPNVLRAVEVARERGLHTLGLTGRDGGKLAGLVDVPIVVPSERTSRIQEAHIAVGHAWCELVDALLYGDDPDSA